MTLFVVAFLSGCATTVATSARLSGRDPGPQAQEEAWQVYPAVRLDAFLIRIFAHAVATGHDGHSQQGPLFQYVAAPLAVVVLCVDTVISAVTDTLLLPFDLYRARDEDRTRAATAARPAP